MTDRLIELVEAWPVPQSAVAVLFDGEVVWSHGDPDWTVPIASVTKVLVTMVALSAVEDGTIDLDEAAGRPDATVRHLLAHAAGYGFDTPIEASTVGTRRAYSNLGFEILAQHLEHRSGIAFEVYLTEAVLEPLGMAGTRLAGSPAHGAQSNLSDLVLFSKELMRPSLVSEATFAKATSEQFPGLGGIVPGIGRFDPNPWGLGFEIKGEKRPHWTGTLTSPETFGHFGGSGTFLWVDPTRSLAVVGLTNRDFDAWAIDSWGTFADEVVRTFGAS